MLNPRSFSEVYSELIEENLSENPPLSHWESSLDPAWLSQLIGSVTPVKFAAPLPLIYRYAGGRAGRPVRPSHVLDETQTQAFTILNLYQSQSLHPGFYATELKSAYRAALLKTHPDQGGTAESFQSVRKSYEILLSFVTK